MNRDKDFFKIFCKVSRAFGTTIKKEELLELIVASAIDALEGKAACLFLDQGGRDEFEAVAQKGLSENYLHAKPNRAKEQVKDVLKGGHFFVYDATTDPRIEHHESKKAEGIASILVVPVMVKGRAIGVLSLYTAKPRDFTQDEIDFLTAMAEQGGIAIENARLLERIRQNSMLFLDLASSINSSLDVKQILHILTADIVEALNMKGVNIRLLNKDSGSLDLVASYGLSEAFINKGPVSSDKSVLRVMRGETVVIKDATKDSQIQYPEAAAKEGIVSMLCVPIKAGNEVIGMMRLFSDKERDFPDDLIILVNALAHQGGLAIQNASMYLALQDDKKDLEKDIWSHRMWF